MGKQGNFDSRKFIALCKVAEKLGESLLNALFRWCTVLLPRPRRSAGGMPERAEGRGGATMPHTCGARQVAGRSRRVDSGRLVSTSAAKRVAGPVASPRRATAPLGITHEAALGIEQNFLWVPDGDHRSNGEPSPSRPATPAAFSSSCKIKAARAKNSPAPTLGPPGPARPSRRATWEMLGLQKEPRAQSPSPPPFHHPVPCSHHLRRRREAGHQGNLVGAARARPGRARALGCRGLFLAARLCEIHAFQSAEHGGAWGHPQGTPLAPGREGAGHCRAFAVLALMGDGPPRPAPYVIHCTHDIGGGALAALAALA